MKYYSCAAGTVCGRFCLVARTGYTGEDGFELFLGARGGTGEPEAPGRQANEDEAISRGGAQWFHG